MFTCLLRGSKIVIDTGRELTEILISQGIRQGCTLSLTLFKGLIREWKKLGMNSGIEISRNTYLNTMLFADDKL